MNQKRHFLEPPEVKDYMVKGERFSKWSEVSKNCSLKNCRKPVLTNISNLNVSTNACVSTKDSTKIAPVTMKMDPKGFYLYWINQSKVIDTPSLAQMQLRFSVLHRNTA